PVVGNVQLGPEFAEAIGNSVHMLLWSHASLGGDALDVHAVLVGAREQKDVASLQALVTGDGIGSNGGVGVANMRYVIGVINRSSQVVGAHNRHSPRLKSGPTVGKTHFAHFGSPSKSPAHGGARSSSR